MFVFSEKHLWQNNPAIIQILVFSSVSIKKIFEDEIKIREEAIKKMYETKEFSTCASDSNAGAIYKLRAERNSDGKYMPVICCGFTDEVLWESFNTYQTSDYALTECFEYLEKSLIADLTNIKSAHNTTKAASL